MELVDIGTLAGAEAEMMQADALLFEGRALMFRGRRADTDRRAPADAIECRLGVDHRLHAEERQEPAIELARARVICGCQEDVRDAVDFHGPPCVAMSGLRIAQGKRVQDNVMTSAERTFRRAW